MITVGVDPSINNTGICINKNDKDFSYILITSKVTKKMNNLPYENIYIYPYDKIQPEKEDDFNLTENIKTENILKITRNIENILKRINPDKVIMEAPSFGSFIKTKSLLDLVGLNYLIRETCIKLNIPFLLVAPQSLKKVSVGNGHAKKEMMIKTWLGLFNEYKNLGDYIKIDDLSDAYFLSIYKSL